MKKTLPSLSTPKYSPRRSRRRRRSDDRILDSPSAREFLPLLRCPTEQSYMGFLAMSLRLRYTVDKVPGLLTVAPGRCGPFAASNSMSESGGAHATQSFPSLLSNPASLDTASSRRELAILLPALGARRPQRIPDQPRHNLRRMALPTEGPLSRKTAVHVKTRRTLSAA
jgi:hypothetical protein